MDVLGDLLIWGTLVVGGFSLVFAVRVALRFLMLYSARRGSDSAVLSRAFAIQVLGEVFVVTGTVAFQAAMAWGLLHAWPHWAQSALRAAMFLVAFLTTLHLWTVIDRKLK